MYNPQTTTRRRISKRYSDIVGPCSNKTSLLRERYYRSSANVTRRYSLKTINERSNIVRKVSRESSIKSNDFLAHRMQVAMSSELMNSLDRNEKHTERKDLIKRSQTFHQWTIKDEKSMIETKVLSIPRVQISFEQEIEEYDEPTVDYDDDDDEEEEEAEEEENPLKDKSDQLPASASFIVPQLSSSNSDIEQKDSIVLRQPTITDDSKSSIVNEQNLECLSSSSPTVSIPFDNESEHRSTSSKIYRDYKQRTSLTNHPTNSSLIIHPMHTKISLRSSTTGSSTATINDKFTDMTLTSKQMNVCVINQLNEHLTARFRQCEQQAQIDSNPIEFTEQNYDLPPEFMSNQIQQTNIYDEPIEQPILTPMSSSIPPPPPP